MIVQRKEHETVNTVRGLKVGDEMSIRLKNDQYVTLTVIDTDNQGAKCIIDGLYEEKKMFSEYRYSSVREYLRVIAELFPEHIHEIMLPVYGKSDILRPPVISEITGFREPRIGSTYWTLTKTSCIVDGYVCFTALGDKTFRVPTAKGTLVRPLCKLDISGSLEGKTRKDTEVEELKKQLAKLQRQIDAQEASAQKTTDTVMDSIASITMGELEREGGKIQHEKKRPPHKFDM